GLAGGLSRQVGGQVQRDGFGPRIGRAQCRQQGRRIGGRGQHGVGLGVIGGVVQRQSRRIHAGQGGVQLRAGSGRLRNLDQQVVHGQCSRGRNQGWKRYRRSGLSTRMRDRRAASGHSRRKVLSNSPSSG